MTSSEYELDWLTADDDAITAAIQTEFSFYAESGRSEDRAEGLDACRTLLERNLPPERKGHFDALRLTWVSDRSDGR